MGIASLSATRRSVLCERNGVKRGLGRCRRNVFELCADYGLTSWFGSSHQLLPVEKWDNSCCSRRAAVWCIWTSVVATTHGHVLVWMACALFWATMAIGSLHWTIITRRVDGCTWWTEPAANVGSTLPDISYETKHFLAFVSFLFSQDSRAYRVVNFSVFAVLTAVF